MDENISGARAARDMEAEGLSVADRLDCEGLARAIEQANVGRKGRDKISDPYLARLAGSLGGSSYAQQWWRYRHARSPIPLIDKMIAAMEFNARPQDLFPSWRFSVLTPIRPGDLGLERLARIRMEMGEKERAGLMLVVERWLKAKPAADPMPMLMPKKKKRAT